jgi:hypothetical protein
MKKNRKNYWFFGVLFAVLLLLPLGVWAAGNQAAKNVYLAQDQVVDGNYYAWGENVEILGTVNSDLFILAGNATISGLVKGDVFFGGGQLRITGEVDGNVRAAGGVVEIDGQIGKNILMAGGNFIFTPKSEINGQLTFAAGYAKIDGTIQGKVDGAGKDLIFNNEVKGDVNLKVGNDGSVTLLPQTHFYNNFYYRSLAKAAISDGAKIDGATNYSVITSQGHKFFTRSFIFNRIIGLFSLLVVGLVIITLFPKPVAALTERLKKKPWANLGWGLFYLIIIPLAVLLLMITVIGLPLGLIILTIYMMILYISQVIIGLTIGQCFADYFKKSYKPIIILTGGLIFYEIITALPYVGWLFKLLGLLLALGAVVEIIKSNWKNKEEIIA